MVSIFLLSAIMIVGPVQAHFTLGNLVGTAPYDINNFDPHVPGVIGYVWPGSGQCAYVGFPNQANDNCPPGYQSPYPSGNPPGAPSNSWYQLQGDTYAPFGAVLAGSTGDLIFALNATAGSNPGGCAGLGVCRTPSSGGGIANDGDKLGWSQLVILLPPGFTLPSSTTSYAGIVYDGSDVVTTITNNYLQIQALRYFASDRYAPGWTAIQISTDGGSSSANGAKSVVSCTSGLGSVGSSCTYYNHQFINFTSADEWYYVRVNGVTAPNIAGRYFFKVQLVGDSNYVAGPEGTAPNATASFTGEAPTQFIPTQNWPVLLVKGEVDPAIVTGTIRYGGYNSTLYGQPVGEAGRVYAHMDAKLDPYTGQQITQCPAMNGFGELNQLGQMQQSTVPGCTDAMGYFNATATGHYEVEGLAAGMYDLYASAAGFPQTLCESGVTILRGQSLHFDCYLQPGPVIHGNVFTKHQFGDEPWMGESLDSNGLCLLSEGCYNEYIKIELYDSPTLSNVPANSAGLVSWSPLPCVAGGQDLLFTRSHAGSCGDPRTASEVAFPWHEYVPSNGYFSQVPGFGNTAAICSTAAGGCYYQVSQSGIDVRGNNNPTLLQDPQGVGPPQHWFVPGGTTTPFHFEMGVKGEYGAPRDLDGMVPQVYATWVNGLTPGRYYVRAWVFRYVQTNLDGATFQEYYFDITPNEWAGDVTLPIDLRLSSWVNKTVHFHDEVNSIVEDPINTGAGFMTGYLMGADGNIYSYNQTALGLTCISSSPPFPTSLCLGRVTGKPLYAGKGGGGGWTSTSAQYGGPPCFGGPCGPGTSSGNSGVDAGAAGVTPGSGVSLDPAPPFGHNVNSNAIQEGRANIQFWGINDTWSGENYGLPSGTYTLYTQVDGYIEEGTPGQLSVTLSGSITSVSDHMIRGPGFNITIYSIDWEHPTVARNWEFGNPEGWNTLAGLFANQLSSNSLTGFINPNNVGAEIDIGAYYNGTIADWTGDNIARTLAASILTSGLFQNQFTNFVELNGGGIDITSLVGAPFDANRTWFGSDLFRPGNIGGILVRPWSQFHNVNGLFILPHLLEPSTFRAGQYDFGAFTYGYIQDQPYAVYAEVGQIADIRINLVIGVNITLDILFKKEGIITSTPYNMSGRVRIFNDQDQLVGEWVTSNGVYTPPSNQDSNPPTGGPASLAVGADGSGQFPFGPLKAVVPQPLPLNEYNYIPGGIDLLHVQIAGLPQVPASGYAAPPGVPVGGYTGDPAFTPLCDFDLVCTAGGYAPPPRLAALFPIPGKSLTYPFPYTGIAGAPDYTGGWTVEVDFVPWYLNNTNTMAAAAGGLQSRSSADSFGQYYAPASGLLLGESYHIIPGTTATSGISLTEDAALTLPRCGGCGLPHGMAFNHLGPYSQEGVWQIAGTHNSGEASGIFEVDLNGFISGNVLGFTYANEFRTESWNAISVVGASGATLPSMYTYDGIYQGFFAPGTYSFTITAPGFTSQTWSVAITPGEVSTGQNIYLQQSQIPVPEFSGIAVAAISALGASAYLLKRRRK